MHEFTPDEIRRWEAWQSRTARSARRSDCVCRTAAITIFAALLIAFAIVVWSKTLY